VAFTGAAAAEMSVSGEANMGVKYDGSDATVHYEIDFGISGSGQTDSGLEFGASVDLDTDISSSGFGDADGEVFISGAFGTLTIGNVDPGNDNLGIGIRDLGFDGIGVDDVAEGGYVNSTADVLYQFGTGPFAVALSGDVNGTTDSYSIGVQYKTDMFNVTLGYDDDGSEAASTIDVEATFDAITVGAMYTDYMDNNYYGVEMGYAMADGITISAVFADSDVATEAAYGVGFSYGLGGGATLAGGVGRVADETVADFGVSMEF